MKNQTKEHILTGRIGVLSVIILAQTFLPTNILPILLVSIGTFIFLLNLDKIQQSFLKIISPLLGVFLIGILGILGHDSRDIYRDILYALTPISLIYIGYWLSDNIKMWPLILKILIFYGIIFSIFHLTQFMLKPSILRESIDVIRELVNNPGGNIIILSLVLGSFQNRIGNINLFPKFFPRYIALPLLFLSFILSFSRTGLFSLILLSISALGLIGRINWRTILSIGLLVFGFTYIILTTPAYEVKTLRSKIAGSIREITISDYQDLADINEHWRGFETYKALSSFESSSFSQKIFGQGFGSLINLGMTMTLGEKEFNEIPVLHNGYAYVFVKTGIMGILFYIFFYFRILKNSLKFKNLINPRQILLSRLLLGCTLSLIFSMFVVGGMAEIHDSEYVLLIGFILRYSEQIQHKINYYKR